MSSGVIVELVREYRVNKTLGAINIYNADCDFVFSCLTLELPWHENQFQISCIPEGIYKVVKRWSKKYGHHFHLTDVEGRTLILIHQGNLISDTLGCILVGSAHRDINGDKILDVTNSKVTMNKLNALLPKEFEIEIKGYNQAI